MKNFFITRLGTKNNLTLIKKNCENGRIDNFPESFAEVLKSSKHQQNTVEKNSLPN